MPLCQPACSTCCVSITSLLKDTVLHPASAGRREGSSNPGRTVRLDVHPHHSNITAVPASAASASLISHGQWATLLMSPDTATKEDGDDNVPTFEHSWRRAEGLRHSRSPE